MAAVENILGAMYGRLTVIAFAGRHAKNTYWTCTCQCKAEVRAAAAHLKRGLIKSCGCLRKEETAKRSFVHGKRASPEYGAWCSMMQRCYNPNHKNFHNYGAKKIGVCDEWRNSFLSFLEDLGPRTTTKHRLLRTKDLGDFSIDTCAWLTPQRLTQKELNDFSQL